MKKNSYITKRLKKTVAVAALLAAAGNPFYSVNTAWAAEDESAVEVAAVDTVKTEEKAESKLVDPDTKKPMLTSELWKPEVQEKLENLLVPYVTGEKVIKHKKDKGPKIKDIPYAIIDLDEAAGINNAQENVIMWQLEHLAFAMDPAQLSQVLKSGMTTKMTHAVYGADDGKGRELLLSSVMDDAVAAYSSLHKSGAVKASGSEVSDSVKESDDYQEFVVKMRWLYDAVKATQGPEISKPWAGYLLTGMTPYEAYSMTLKGIEFYGDFVDENAKSNKKKKKVEQPKTETWDDKLIKSPAGVSSKTGRVSVTQHQGIKSTKQVSELVNALQKSGMDVWFVSSAGYDLARAALNYYHVPGMDGILALRTNVDKNGKYVNQYNEKYNVIPYGEGKLAAVKKNITDYYKAKNPLLIAEDSSFFKEGDEVELSKEYPNSELIITFNNGVASDAR